ncbi:hypothetical protein BO70DRAFT_360089 [Aspergillus heteromorphus CBS 117.55]|uniref:Protein kinase domain-containing protein n=1 Tax=Aspergillus heteromorphus CBS 117.55 TaxID=1448321 RepID=A0A317WMB2_9EURO|nr:uncharacterized protein BO70DRAFT_360089 [Aspergillus heteromorphus CBS 117.55]PWY87473.1 hypothetical protein BO70DRAFT_360089 [Aspergillus heteromorphus CBS 117.55]
MSNLVDYKALLLEAEEKLRKADEERKKADEERKKAEEERRQEKILREQAETRNRPTTFEEFIQHCHNLLSKPLKAGNPAQSTTGKIPSPTGKYCPVRLEPWTDCVFEQQRVYNSVHQYLHPFGREAPRLFSPCIVLEEYGQRFAARPITSEKDLEIYERFAVENHVFDIISALCKIPSAREEFGLEDGVWFDNHANALDEDPPDEANSKEQPARPDQFCIHRVDGDTRALLTTVEYKPPHKLSNENLRAGLRPMNFYHEIVESETVPTDGPEKLRYNAARLAGSAIVQEYHVMIQEGLEYSYLTTGLGIVLLRVPDDCSILYYYLCEPNFDVESGIEGPRTAIERVLCLCLMSFQSVYRDQSWRNAARSQLPTWETSFSYARSQIPSGELQQKPPESDYTSPECTSSEITSSEYQPSSPFKSPASLGRRPSTRSTCRAPAGVSRREDSSEPDDDSTPAAQRKRGFSEIASSPPAPRSMPTTPKNPPQRYAGQSRSHSHEFCTQKCLLGLQRDDILDPQCPNVKLHRVALKTDRHPIRAAELVTLIKQQLDKNLDEYCTPLGQCGSYGAPFKVTCAAYGYTVVGKGTTSRLWHEVSQEADIYRILQSIQGSAVPVFLGLINLANIYFLHGAGEIRHMLLMSWGGKSLRHKEIDTNMQRHILRSERSILSLGVVHDDLRPENILWNDELQQVLIIDFHRCHLNHQMLLPKSTSSRKGLLKRMYTSRDELRTKRKCVN